MIYGQPHDDPPHVYLSGWATDYLGCGQLHRAAVPVRGRLERIGLLQRPSRRRIGEAKQLQVTDPAAANAAWIEIEHQLVEGGGLGTPHEPARSVRVLGPCGERPSPSPVGAAAQPGLGEVEVILLR